MRCINYENKGLSGTKILGMAFAAKFVTSFCANFFTEEIIENKRNTLCFQIVAKPAKKERNYFVFKQHFSEFFHQFSLADSRGSHSLVMPHFDNSCISSNLGFVFFSEICPKRCKKLVLLVSESKTFYQQ